MNEAEKRPIFHVITRTVQNKPLPKFIKHLNCLHKYPRVSQSLHKYSRLKPIKKKIPRNPRFQWSQFSSIFPNQAMKELRKNVYSLNLEKISHFPHLYLQPRLQITQTQKDSVSIQTPSLTSENFDQPAAAYLELFYLNLIKCLYWVGLHMIAIIFIIETKYVCNKSNDWDLICLQSWSKRNLICLQC